MEITPNCIELRARIKNNGEELVGNMRRHVHNSSQEKR
jgi:hypothetical protein